MANLGLGQSLAQRGEQHMLLLPAMLQSIEILQLSAVELVEYVQEAVEANEALTLEPAEPRPDPRSDEGDRVGARARTSAAARAASDRHDELLQAQPERAKSLVELVEAQLVLADLSPELAPWVRCVVAALDDNGYLSASDAELLAMARERGLVGAATLTAREGPEREPAEREPGGREPAEREPCGREPGERDPSERDLGDRELGLLGRAIACVQRLEPRGIGGRNAIEALLLQLDPRDPDYRLLCRLLEDFLEDVARNKLPAVARSLGIELERLNELIATLGQLHVRPAADLCAESAPLIVPEVVVELCDGRFEVRVVDAGLPAVAIEPGIRALAADKQGGRELKRYLRGKLEGARALIEALEQRRRTLLRTAVAIFEHQRAFLEHGPGHLVPLRMGDLAAELGLATSTISRAVAGKHAQTPWGIQPLRWFFQGAGGACTTVAREDVRALVAALFAGESAQAPLSDDEVVAALRAQGYELARRTVAKYRQELGIESSYRRRHYA